MTGEESQSAQTVPTKAPQNVATLHRENMREKKEPEKTTRENETTWNKILEKLQEALPLGESAARLDGTALLQITDTAARIGVSNTTALVWLERRLYQQIRHAIKGVVGKDLDLQFVTSPL
jgi:hypothetical protein